MINYLRIRAVLIYICTIAITFHIFWGRYMNPLYLPLFYTCILLLLACVLILGWVNFRNASREKKLKQWITVGKKSRMKSFLALHAHRIIFFSFFSFLTVMLYSYRHFEIPDYIAYMFWMLLGISIGIRIAFRCSVYLSKYPPTSKKDNDITENTEQKKEQPPHGTQ